MKLTSLKLPEKLFSLLSFIDELRPAQEKSVDAGLLDGKSLLVTTPTSSGKTLIAELAMMNAILNNKGKAVYVVPLRALAAEKHRDFQERYKSVAKVAHSSGDIDSTDSYLADYDIIVCTAEKLDSLIRHHAPWLSSLAVIVVDEVHLLNDPSRGPTLEILLTMLREIVPNAQLLALSATIGNPEELAEWLQADLVQDDWRPVTLHKGTYRAGAVEFH